MSFRTWVSIITVILLALVIFFGRHEIVHAWHLLSHVNLWILALIIPVQFFSYYATGGMIFSYLRAKGDLKDTSHLTMTRMSLELNFVNHILPSGGAAGFSYLGWVLARHNVSPGRAAMAQIVRFALTFIAFIVLLIVAVIALTLDGKVNRIIILLSFILVMATVLGGIGLIYVIGNKRHLTRFSAWLTRVVNGFVSKITRGKKPTIANGDKIEKFFLELNQDYAAIKADKRILIKPFIWALFTNAADVTLLLIAFLALGSWVNPAALFVAFGLASVVSIVSIAPGGAGIYELVMIGFLVSSSDVHASVAIAGTLLARVILLLGTIAFGYVFYQMTILKYGKSPIKKVQ